MRFKRVFFHNIVGIAYLPFGHLGHRPKKM